MFLRSSTVIHSIIATLLATTAALAQSDNTPLASWYLPGIAYKPSGKVSLLGQYGNNSRLNLDVLYLQAFIRLNGTVTLNPAYLGIMHTPDAGRRRWEHTLMNAVIFAFHIGKLKVEDRNLVWNRFRMDAGDIHLYRNRIRISGSFFESPRTLTLYGFNEVTFRLDEFGWSRNRFSAGTNYHFTHWFSIDVSLAREHDAASGKMNLLFIMATVELPLRRKN